MGIDSNSLSSVINYNHKKLGFAEKLQLFSLVIAQGIENNKTVTIISVNISFFNSRCTL